VPETALGVQHEPPLVRSANTGSPEYTAAQQLPYVSPRPQQLASPPAPCIAVSQHDLHVSPPAYGGTYGAL
jgi:hypothetical protein